MNISYPLTVSSNISSSTSSTRQNPIVSAIFTVFCLLTLLTTQSAVAEQATLAWDAVNHPLVAGYELQYGLSSDAYTHSADAGNQLQVTVDGLQVGSTYYFAVRAYNQDRTIWSNFSEQISANIEAPLVADFTASSSSGVAPLTVVFEDLSNGDVTSRDWDFGDGGASTGQTAVYTYTQEGTYTVSLTVTGPGGSSMESKANYIAVTVQAPVADFTAGETSGVAPFAVTFSDTSSGEVTTRSWDFGGGSTGTGATVSHVYTEAGTYDVMLTASGSGGADSEIKPGYITVSAAPVIPPPDPEPDPQQPQLEIGELEIDYQWQRIPFEKIFWEPPIVVAKALSAQDATPATVRIRNIDSTGFEIRVQEWDYLYDTHGYETVSYLAMEPGSWQLADGTKIEANRLETNAAKFWESVVFKQPFDINPVVLAAVNTEHEVDAVITRLKNIDVEQFQVRMYEQEINSKSHAVETISYIAWEPSTGTLDGVPFEVGMTPNKVKHKPYAIDYQSAFSVPPMFLADMQTTDGADTSNVRCRGNSANGIEVWIQEEQSKNSEMRHTTETIGYMSIGQ